ncbi:hypothetical protein FQZ97_902820 [compost metagenome]
MPKSPPLIVPLLLRVVTLLSKRSIARPPVPAATMLPLLSRVPSVLDSSTMPAPSCPAAVILPVFCNWPANCTSWA